jgi:dihydroxyacid dehydratase/phosphogluconate dehydratase
VTVSGKTIGENHKDIVFPSDQKVVYKTSKPISSSGRFCWFKRKLGTRWSYYQSSRIEEKKIYRKSKMF